VDLDQVPKKYDGLDGTELAISESQERMAVVVEARDADAFIALAAAENLAAARVATVTGEKRLVMRWRGETVADLARGFLNTNGAPKHVRVRVGALPVPRLEPPPGPSLRARFEALVSGLACCGQLGLGQRFDSTIGAASVLMPFGGRRQLTPAQAMVMKLPVDGETATCAGMAFGFDPAVSAQNPYAGAYLAVVHSVAKLAASGFDPADMVLSLQEYFPRLRGDPERWGLPLAALLGALQAQMDLGIAAIGGKDSMSGSFENLDVPPTLVSFAVAPGRVERVTGNEFQLPQSRVVWLRPAAAGPVPNALRFKLVMKQLAGLMAAGRVLACHAVGSGGAAEALFKMCLGNQVGFELDAGMDPARLFEPAIGSFIVELDGDAGVGETLGVTTGRYTLKAGGENLCLEDLQARWLGRLEPVFPVWPPAPPAEKPATLSWRPPGDGGQDPPVLHRYGGPALGPARPRALIPVFPGTNCEYDTARALRAAGAEADIFVVCNRSPRQVADSAAELARRIQSSQMLVLPGGFSAGDEPEGSAKLICAFFRGAAVAGAVTDLLERRGGLVLGICNGFQALLKLGLLPYGKITAATPDSATLTFNAIGRHQSMLVRTRVASARSPWLGREAVGSIHTVAVSHGEGRLAAPPELLRQLEQNGQIVTQYVDFSGEASMDVRHNPGGSALAIEGLCSADGRVLGKMGHSERAGEGLYKNVPGNKHQALFESGVDYFSKGWS
jgi:phosphoribosylformylglycinamidine synthase